MAYSGGGVQPGFTTNLQGLTGAGGSAATPQRNASLGGLGWLLGVTGAMTSAVGTFYALSAEKDELKARALSADFEATMSARNARQAEIEAQGILEAGEAEIGALRLQGGLERAATTAALAARGGAMSGSNAEVIASQRLVTELEAYSMRRSVVGAASAARMQAVDFRNRSELARVSAGNLRRTAGTIRPVAGAIAGGLGTVGRVAGQWADRRWWSNYDRSS